MNRQEKATSLHHKGYNCAQAVACSFSDRIQIDEKTMFMLMEGYGFGMGDTYGTCGAISGAVAVISLLGSKGNLDGPYSKADTYKAVKTLTADFRVKNGATICRDLKGMDTKIMLRSCDGCIEDAVTILEKMIDDKSVG